MGISRAYIAAELIIDLPQSSTIIMALQPNIQVLNQAVLDFTGEIAKFPNIPALAEGNAILDAIAALGNRMTADLTTNTDRLVTRLRAA